MRVGSYLRVSTDEQVQQGNSMFEQKERLAAYCKSNGWPVPTFYEDDGYSAKDMRRPALTRLLEDVKKGKFDLVITTKLDRLSRKLSDILHIVESLSNHNCNYTSTSQAFDTSTPQGKLMLQMLGAFAELEREMISERVRDNMKSIARNSKKAITVPCYGYDVIDGQFVINEEEAKNVRMMADMMLSGKGTRFIAKKLNDIGAKSKTGKHWSETTVRQLLERETLIGQMVYNRSYKKNGRTLIRPQEEWIVIEDHHEPILEEETFYEMQRLKDSRKHSNKHADNEKWLLSGLVICSHCGAKMIGKGYIKNYKKNNRSAEYLRYICSAYQKKGLCFHHQIDRDGLEQAIIYAVKQLSTVTQPNKLHLVVSHTKQEFNELEMLQARLRKLDQKMQKQIEAFEDDLISGQDLKRARERIDEERKTITQSIEEINLSGGSANNNKIVSNAKRLLNDVLSDDRLTVKNAIRKLVNQIVVTDGADVEIRYNQW